MLENITKIAITEHLEIDVANSGSRQLNPCHILWRALFLPRGSKMLCKYNILPVQTERIKVI